MKHVCLFAVLAAITMPDAGAAEYAADEAAIVDTDEVEGPAPGMLGGLRRQADLGFRFGESDGRLEVRRVDEDSAAARAGLLAGDAITAINGEPFPKAVVGNDRLVKLRGNDPVLLTVARDGDEHEIAFTPPPRDWEQLTGLEAEYGVLETSDGARLRTIITRPKEATGPLPTVFMIQWVGCSSLEFQHEGPWLMVYKAAAERSGMAMIRVERSANGDSEGPPCHLLDMDTEIDHYDQAYSELTSHPWVDAKRIVLMGNSLGTKTVPLVAQGKTIAGVIVSSGGGLSYFERMINFDRHALSHEDRDPAEAHDILMAQMPFQVMYLLEGMTPEEIVAERPDLDGVWETIAHTGDGHHYGRPYAYHHQAAQKDYLEAWTKIDAPGQLQRIRPVRGTPGRGDHRRHDQSAPSRYGDTRRARTARSQFPALPEPARRVRIPERGTGAGPGDRGRPDLARGQRLERIAQPDANVPPPDTNA